jgi:DNA-binding NtrC family response regulator
MELSPEALEVLMRHPWPGNVRELENEAERLVALASNPVIRPDDLSWEIRYGKADGQTLSGRLPENLREAEERIIRKVLSDTGNNKAEAARRLGISREGLRKKLKKLNA